MYSPYISFGQKIPIGSCKIKDLRENKLVEANLFQLDCKDESDLSELESLDNNWIFKEDILSKMKNTRRTMGFKRSSASFYTLENKEGKIIGISQIKDENPDFVLDYLESEHEGKYRFVGQNMLALLSKIALEKDFKRILVPVPIKEARDFYLKKCGFRSVINDCSVSLSRHGMKKLQKRMDKIV